MSTTTPFKELYQKEEATELYWKRFVEMGGFASLSKGYLAQRLDNLLAEPLQLAPPAKIDWASQEKRALLFVNGFFDKESSRFPEAMIFNSKEAALAYTTFFEGHLQKIKTKEKSALVTLNGAFVKEGAFLVIPADTVIKEPIKIEHLFTSTSFRSFAASRLQIIVGKNSHVTFIQEQVMGEGLCANQLLDLQLEEGASVDFITTLKESENGTLFEAVRATLKKKSHFRSYVYSEGAQLCIRDYHIELVGEESSAEVKAALRLGARRQEQMDVIMEHKAARCRSDQLIKQVGYFATRHSFSGTIHVHKEAKETESYQKHSALLLDPTAMNAVRPNLEIFTDEVKASHGATVGQLNEDALFYFASRGIDRKRAEALLIEAHLKEALPDE